MEQINVFLRKILESGDDGGVAAVRKALDLYASCINTPRIDALGAQPLIDLINSTGISNHIARHHVSTSDCHNYFLYYDLFWYQKPL